MVFFVRVAIDGYFDSQFFRLLFLCHSFILTKNLNPPPVSLGLKVAEVYLVFSENPHILRNFSRFFLCEIRRKKTCDLLWSRKTFEKMLLCKKDLFNHTLFLTLTNTHETEGVT